MQLVSADAEWLQQRGNSLEGGALNRLQKTGGGLLVLAGSPCLGLAWGCYKGRTGLQTGLELPLPGDVMHAVCFNFLVL